MFLSQFEDIFSLLLLIPLNSFSFDRKKQKVSESKTHPLATRAHDNLKEKLKTKFSCKKFQCELSFAVESVERARCKFLFVNYVLRQRRRLGLSTVGCD